MVSASAPRPISDWAWELGWVRPMVGGRRSRSRWAWAWPAPPGTRWARGWGAGLERARVGRGSAGGRPRRRSHAFRPGRLRSALGCAFRGPRRLAGEAALGHLRELVELS